MSKTVCMDIKPQFIKLFRNLVFFLVLFGCVSKQAISSSESFNCLNAKTKWDLWRVKTCLRGANIWQKKIDPSVDGNGLGTDPIGPPYPQTDFLSLAALGANYVNISHPGLYTEKAPYGIDTQAVQNLDALLSKIEKANMYAVISFRTGPGRNEETFSGVNSKANNDVWKSAEAQKAWAQMWKFTAERYKNNPIVVGYDLMVEPNSSAVLLGTDDPKEFYAKYKDTLYDFGPLAKAATLSIRETDSETPILLGVMDWSSVYWLEDTPLSEDSKTVYVIHSYSPYEYTHQYSPYKISYPGYLKWGERLDATWLENTLRPVYDFKQKHKVPVVVNEFGVMRWEKGASTYLDDHMSILENLGVNYSYWLWESSYSGISYDEFDYRKGTKSKNHRNQSDNELLRTLKKYFTKNQSRPKKP